MHSNYSLYLSPLTNERNALPDATINEHGMFIGKEHYIFSHLTKSKKVSVTMRVFHYKGLFYSAFDYSSREAGYEGSSCGASYNNGVSDKTIKGVLLKAANRYLNTRPTVQGVVTLLLEKL